MQGTLAVSSVLISEGRVLLSAEFYSNTFAAHPNLLEKMTVV
jgi:hypothetical protein